MNDDGELVHGTAAIAKHLYGDNSPSNVRRVRNQIERHNLPIVQRGGIWSFSNWLDRWQRGEEVVVGGGK